MEILRSYIRQVLLEQKTSQEPTRDYRLQDLDFFYEEFTSDVISWIMATTRKGRKRFSNRFIWEYPVDSDVWNETWNSYGSPQPWVFIKCQVRRVDFLSANPQHPGWNIKGDAGWGSEPDSAEIFVDIQLDPTINPKKMRPELISDLTHELWNVIAHEAHHLTQDEGPLQRPSCPVPLPQESSSYFHYFVSGCEVPAFLIGFRSEAKSRGVPIETLMDAYLQNHVNVDHLKQADVKKIRDSWLAHNKWLKA